MRKTEFKRFCFGKMKGFVDEIWQKAKSMRTAEDFLKIETECWERGGTEFGGSTLKAVLESLEDKRHKHKCKKCGRAMERQRVERKYKTLVGEVAVARWYYYCRYCGGGGSPLDEIVTGGEGDISWGLKERIGEAASDWGFEKSSGKLRRYSRVNVSGSTIRAHSERIGQKIAHEQKTRPLAEGRFPEGGERSVDIDAGKMHTKEKGWVDVKIAVFAGEGSEGDEIRHYNMHCGNYKKWGKSLRRSASAAGLEKYEDLDVRGDGADWIWELSRTNFPGAENMVDFYHAAEHICGFGKAVYGEGTKKSRQFNDEACGILKHKGPEAALERIKKVKPKKKAFRVALDGLAGYIEKRKDKMNYPERIKENRSIGSGKVESACKEILNKRVKQGRRWRLRNGMAIANLRAAWLSGDWSVYYKRCLKAA